MSKKILTIAAFLSITSLHAADNDKFVRKGYTPKHTVPVQTIKMRDRAPISEQILKDEICTCTLPVIQHRIQNAAQYMQPSNIGHPARLMIYLTIKRTFNKASTDQLTKTIFDIVNKNESKQDFVAEPSILVNNSSGYTVALATPREIDMFTNYEKIAQHDGSFTIECTTRLSSKSYIEEVVADMTQKVEKYCPQE